MKRQYGYTLAEVILALGFITCVILYCFLILSHSYSIIRSTEEDLVAVNLANQQMEFFRSGFARVPPIGGPYDYNNVPEGYNNVNLVPPTNVKNRVFIVKSTVAAVPGCDPEVIRHVTVEVLRQGGPGGYLPRKLVIDSYIRKN
ncbi:MAG: hypothetical protein LWY06_11340 [Firmicutes bacterium]|nr:hypothetical protein [Bacillota bacterium]